MASCPLGEGQEGVETPPLPALACSGSLKAWQLNPSLLIMKRKGTGRVGGRGGSPRLRHPPPLPLPPGHSWFPHNRLALVVHNGFWKLNL